MPFLRQNTIKLIRFGPFLDSGDGVTEEIALTITQALRRLSKDGAAFAASGETGNSTHDSDGWYFDNLTAADTNTVGELILNVQDPTTHLPVWMRWWVLEEAVFDAIYGAAAEGPIQSTVAGRTLDVNAAGEAGLDLANVSGVLGQANVGWVDANSRVDVGQFLGNAVVISTGLPDMNVATFDNIAAPVAWVASFNDPSAATISATVWAETVRILTASTNFNDISTAQVNTQVDLALADIHLDHLFATDYDPAAIPGVAGAWINELSEDDGDGLIRYTAKALENVPISGGGFVTGVWRWDTDVTATDPGSGDVKGNNAALASITSIFISATTNNDFNADEFLRRLTIGDKIVLAREGGGGANYVQATVSGSPTDNTGWWTVPVTVDDSAGSFSANNTINVTLGYAAATAEAIADAVWDENVVSAHGAADSAGLIISELTKRSVTFSTAVVSGSIFDQIADDGTAVYDRTTDSLQAIADSGGGGPTAAQIADAVWDENKADHEASGSTGEALGGTLINQTTILSLVSQVLFTLNGGSLDDDAYNNCLVVIVDQTDGFQKAYGKIETYAGSSRGVTLKADPGIYTMAVNDLVLIYANPTGVNVDQWNGADVAVPSVAGVPEVDVTHQVGGLVPTPFTAGIPDVNVAEWRDVVPLTLVVGRINASVGSMATDVITSFALDQTAVNEISDGVWDELKFGHEISGSMGQAQGGALLQTSTIASFVSNALFTIGSGSTDDNAYENCLIVIIDQTTGTQKAFGEISSYTGGTRTVVLDADPATWTFAVGDLVMIYAYPRQLDDKTGYSIAVGGFPVGGFVTDSITADAMAIDFGQEVADRILARNIGAGSDGGRTIQDAYRAIRNRRAIVAGTLSVYEEDDSTVAWAAAVTTTFGNPISEIDPA